MIRGAIERQQVVAVAAGDEFSAAVADTGEVYTWGRGAESQLGHPTAKNELEPKKVENLAGSFITSVACGSRHTLAVTS